MFKTTKIYSCSSCGKTYKNSQSLATHKYKLHSRSKSPRLAHDSQHTVTPKSAELDDNSYILSDPSSITDEIWELSSESIMNKLGIEFLEQAVRELKVLVTKLDIKASINDVIVGQIEKYIKGKEYKDQTRQNLRINNTEDIFTVKKQNQYNSQRIRELEKLIEGQNKKDQDNQTNTYEDHKIEDAIEDIYEVQEMLSKNNYEGFKSNIIMLRRSIRLILDNIDFKNIDDEEVQLLLELANASKRMAKDLLPNNFSRLTNIFTTLNPQFGRLLEGEKSNVEISENDSEEIGQNENDSRSDGTIDEDRSISEDDVQDKSEDDNLEDGSDSLHKYDEISENDNSEDESQSVVSNDESSAMSDLNNEQDNNTESDNENESVDNMKNKYESQTDMSEDDVNYAV